MDDFYSDIIKFCVNKKFENDDKIYGNKRFDFFDNRNKQLKNINHETKSSESSEENLEYIKIKQKIRKKKK
jgi:hypothetical protein